MSSESRNGVVSKKLSICRNRSTTFATALPVSSLTIALAAFDPTSQIEALSLENSTTFIYSIVNVTFDFGSIVKNEYFDCAFNVILLVP